MAKIAILGVEQSDLCGLSCHQRSSYSACSLASTAEQMCCRIKRMLKYEMASQFLKYGHLPVSYKLGTDL